MKEGDQEEVPMVTPRAYLPAGVENYVTPTGMQELQDEREALLQERLQYENVDNNDARINRNYLSAKLQLLEERIRTARVLEYNPKKQKEIAFGAVIQYKNLKLFIQVMDMVILIVLVISYLLDLKIVMIL